MNVVVRITGSPSLGFHGFMVCIALLALAACSPRAVKTNDPHHAATARHRVEAAGTHTGEKTFTSARYGVRIDYPADLELRRNFKRSYLANGNWKTYAGPDTPPGKAIFDLIMPDSNDVTAGELRLGASRDPAAIHNCARLPSAARPGSKGQTTISGVNFTTYTAGDAAMSHYLMTRSFRAVHHGACYAMDVLVFGTNPKVYSPPKKPPFTKKQVFKRLIPVAHNLQFIPSAASATHSPIAPPATYTGLLPCADCPGIDYQLNLLRHHRYVLRLTYRDRDTHFDEHGHWQLSRDGKTLTLSSKDSQPHKWAVQNDGRQLTFLNGAGNPIHSKLNYTLTRSVRFEPITPGPAAGKLLN
jgi:uncharacterized lipoprotein NlpE involved in copper resistance